MKYLEKAFLSIPQEDEEYIQLSMDLAAQIDKYRRDKKLTRRKLAEEIGKEESEISRWLSGTHNFTVKTLAKIQSFFGQKLFVVEKDLQSNVQTYIITHFPGNYHQINIYSNSWVNQKYNFDRNNFARDNQLSEIEAHCNG